MWCYNPSYLPEELIYNLCLNLMHKIFVVNCFCSDASGSGNPAAVVTDFENDDSECQMLAKKLRKPVTVFISDVTEEKPTIKFFYPDTRMPLCLHGTLAAGKIIFATRKQQELICLTDEGRPLYISKFGKECLQVKVSSQELNEYDINKEIVTKMLNLFNTNDITEDLPFYVSSVGSPKLLIPLRSLKLLMNLQPNYQLIKKWSIENNVNGLYVYTKETYSDSSSFHARGFNPKTGHNEDAATGVAAAALASALKKDIKVEQGYAISNPCLIIVTYNSPVEILVGGKISATERF